MGAWGVMAFENDNALDWVGELEDAESTSVLRDALNAVASADDIIEDCEEALAAAEVVAALLGRPLEELPEEVIAFVEEHAKAKPEPELVMLARTTVERIAEASDLKERWEESDSVKDWYKAMNGLLARLGV